MTDIRDTSHAKAGSGTKPPEALPPHPELVASEIVEKIKSVVSLKAGEGEHLAGQIQAVLVERMGSFDDMRMGRILGHAIATI